MENLKALIKKFLLPLFLIGITIGVSIAYKQNTEQNIPFPLLLIFAAAIIIAFYRSTKRPSSDT